LDEYLADPMIQELRLEKYNGILQS